MNYIYNLTTPCAFPVCSGTINFGAFNADDVWGAGPELYGQAMLVLNSGCPPGGIGELFACSDITTSQTVIDLTTSGGCGGCATGTVTITLSNEYDTTTLISNTVAALPSYPGTFAGTCSSLRNLSSDELTYSIRRFKYKFVLPDLTGFSCYKITWLEGSAAKSYLWNGTDTETPVYGEVAEPGTNGTIGISSVVYSCACS